MAITLPVNNIKEIAFCGSPQYINVHSTGDSGIPATRLNLELDIWHGNKDKTGSPTIVTRNFSIDVIPLVSPNTIGTFEISQYILKELEPDIFIPTPVVGVPQYNGTAGVWFDYVVTSDVQEDPLLSPAKFGTAGTGTYNDGINSGTTVLAEQNTIFGHQTSKLIADIDKNYMFPVYIGGLSTNSVILTSIGNVEIAGNLGFTLNSQDSAEQIAYCILGSSVFPTTWNVGAKIQYQIADLASIIPLLAPIYGLYFDGASYMNIDIVDLITSAGDYIELKFRAVNWQNKNPFGYTGGDDITVTPDATYALSLFKIQDSLGINSGALAGIAENDLVLRFEYNSPGVINYFVNGVSAGTTTANTVGAVSPEDFFLGASNSLGVPQLYAQSIWYYADFNGKVYNDDTDWQGSQNNGGLRIVSFDNGVTWYPAEQEVYQFNVECHSGRPKVIKYLNEHGAISEFPINGSDFDSLSTRKTTFSNLRIDTTATPAWDNLRHVKRTFDVDSIISIEVDTGWIFEDTPRMIAEMLVSKFVWLETPDRIEPAYITNSSQRFIRRLYRHQTGYKLTLEIARPVLNTVR